MIENKTGYLRPAFRPERVAEQVRTEVPGDVDYDTLVGIGLSGSLVVPRVATILGKHWALIRKTGENSHSWAGFEGEIGSRWLFLDDLISTGSSLAKVRTKIDQLAAEYNSPTTYVGAYLYSSETGGQNGWVPPGEEKGQYLYTRRTS
jgi:orotate phosphoribosyltransferase